MQCLANRAYCWEHRGRVVWPISCEPGRPGSVHAEIGQANASDVREQRSR